MSQSRKKFGDLDVRIRPYHVKDAPWIITISHVGIEMIPDLFAQQPPQGEVLTVDDGEQFDPYAPKPVKKGTPALKPAFVLWFHEFGSRRNFLLNKTNERTLIAAFGKDPRNAKHKLIVLKYGKTRQGKETVILEIAPPGSNPGLGVYETDRAETTAPDAEPVPLGDLTAQAE